MGDKLATTTESGENHEVSNSDNQTKVLESTSPIEATKQSVGIQACTPSPTSCPIDVDDVTTEGEDEGNDDEEDPITLASAPVISINQ